MAILRGFPPSNTISPSVRIAEKDLSFIAPNQSFHRGALVGFASKGPINTPTLVSTRRQLNTVFGYPHPDVSDPFLIYAAEQYLNSANELYIVRVADEEAVSNERAESAYVDVPSAGSTVEIISKQEGPYNFTVDSFFRWRLNTVLSSKTLVVSAGEYSANELASALNDQIDTVNDGIIFFSHTVNTDTYIGVKTVWAYGPNSSLELVSVKDSIYGATGVTGLGVGMTQAEVVASNYGYSGTTDAAVNGIFNFSGMTGLNIQLVLDGTDSALIDNVVQVIDLSAFDGESGVTLTELVTAINEQRISSEGGSEEGTLPGGWEAYEFTNDTNDYLAFNTKHYGRDARLRVKAVGVALDVFGMSTATATGVSPVQSSAVAVDGSISNSDSDVGGIIVGSDNTGMSQITFTVYADSPGIEGNRTQVKITNNSYENNFSMEVYSNGVQVESWGNLTKDPASSYYVESYLAQVSDYVRVVDASDISSPPLNSTTYSPLSGAYSLTGGSDGIPSDPEKQDDLIIGSALGYTGIYALSEPEQIDIDLIAVPGHSSTNVVMALIDLCQNVRMDCMAIIDPPFGLTVKEIVQWQNGAHPLNNDRFDSDFAALYWPWVKIRDTFNLIDVWVPPSGAVMSTFARSDSLSAPWFAPAGLNRGTVSNILDVYDRPTLEERDLMYGNRNCVNPIIQFVDIGGFVIFGQKTLQRKPTALDRVNVRRLMLTIEKQLRTASRSLLFEPNDDIFRQRFEIIASGILDTIQVGRGITAYIIKADTELNTADVIDRNEFRARIGIQPVRAAEFIFLEFSIHRTGSFAETA
jgi:phage tail sheath protein FI